MCKNGLFQYLVEKSHLFCSVFVPWWKNANSWTFWLFVNRVKDQMWTRFLRSQSWIIHLLTQLHGNKARLSTLLFQNIQSQSLLDSNLVCMTTHGMLMTTMYHVMIITIRSSKGLTDMISSKNLTSTELFSLEIIFLFVN